PAAALAPYTTLFKASSWDRPAARHAVRQPGRALGVGIGRTVPARRDRRSDRRLAGAAPGRATMQPRPTGISVLTRQTVAFVLAGGRGSRLEELTDRRAKPAVYFGGKSRIIDFALSNAVNSGIRRIGVATQYKAHSLIRHL